MNSVLVPLRNPVFRRLWFGNMISNLGTMFQSVGAAWLMMTMTGSPQMVGLVQSCVTLPLLIFSLFTGALADTLDRRRIMLVAQLQMFVMAVALTLLVAMDWLTPSLLLLFTFLIGSGGALHIASWQTSVRDMVDRSELASAVAINSMGFNLMRSAGPAIGGAILALAGASLLFALNALTYLVLAVLLLSWRSPRPDALMREPLGSAVFSGLRYSALSPNLVSVILRGFVFCVIAISLMSLLPVVAKTMLGGGSVLFGGLLGSFGLGAVFAALISPGLRERFTIEQLVSWNFALFAAALLLIATVGGLVVAYVSTFLAGCSWVLTNSTLNVTIQLSTPRWVVGRSLSILHTGLFGGMTLGSWGWGFLAEHNGVETALLISAAALFVAAFMGKLLPMPEVSDTGLEPANIFREPEVKVDLHARPGPINIAIHFVIADEDEAKFLEIMAKRRQVRRRDGALRWALRRDVEHPDHWIEVYQVRTWADYIRHNQRRTTVDAELYDRLVELHRGPNPPEVQRMVEWDAMAAHHHD